MSRASIALMACACALQVQAQTKEEVITDVVLQAADAWDRAREAKRAREAEQARQAQASAEEAARLREQEKKADEERRQKEAAAVRNWPGLGGLIPPLEPGEAYGETSNGCGIVLKVDESKTIEITFTSKDGKQEIKRLTAPEFLRLQVWTGDCSNGLAHGLGTFASNGYVAEHIDSKYEYSYGRQLSRELGPIGTSATRYLTYRLSDGDVVVVTQARNDPFAPRFAKPSDDINSTRFTLSRGGQGTVVYAQIVSCLVLEKRPRGCSLTKDFDVPAVTLKTYGNGPEQYQHTQCPELRNGKGCEALWQQIAGPVIAEIQPLIAQADADDQARRKRYADLNAMFLLNARVMRMANDLQAQHDRERRMAAAAAGEAEEKKKREAAEAERLAKQKQAELDFKAQLTRLNAGQLYVMADELKTAGKSTQAREALHALISRFPEHALAGNAASMLTTLK
jgi:hypothetical protein